MSADETNCELMKFCGPNFKCPNILSSILLKFFGTTLWMCINLINRFVHRSIKLENVLLRAA